ncbi:MAG: hypothetical protein JWM59_2620 [Verrucomicrobiales bacterium]|nr:hypothetical protein [Verrucomicrobiales bacterium]
MAATVGSSWARDLAAVAYVAGDLVVVSPITLPVPATLLTVGPINSASDTAPIPYASTIPVVGAGAGTEGVLDLDLTTAVDSLDIASDVDGAEGSRSAIGNITLTDASATLGVIGLVDILTLNLDTTTALVSNSSVTWDGATLTPVGTSNFITSGAVLNLNILGVNVVLPALAANASVPFTVDVSALGLRVQGDVSIRVDAVDILTGGDTASANTISVLFSTELSVTSALGTALDLNTTVALNQSSAQLTAVPVPEPGVSTGVMLAAAGLLMRRGRRRSGAA